MFDFAHYYVYFGSRASQPLRARAFIDLAAERSIGNTAYVLGMDELVAGEERAVQLARNAR